MVDASEKLGSKATATPNANGAITPKMSNGPRFPGAGNGHSGAVTPNRMGGTTPNARSRAQVAPWSTIKAAPKSPGVRMIEVSLLFSPRRQGDRCLCVMLVFGILRCVSSSNLAYSAACQAPVCNDGFTIC